MRGKVTVETNVGGETLLHEVRRRLEGLDVEIVGVVKTRPSLCTCSEGPSVDCPVREHRR